MKKHCHNSFIYPVQHTKSLISSTNPHYQILLFLCRSFCILVPPTSRGIPYRHVNNPYTRVQSASQQWEYNVPALTLILSTRLDAARATRLWSVQWWLYMDAALTCVCIEFFVRKKHFWTKLFNISARYNYWTIYYFFLCMFNY